jgi:predicted nucleic acid-binding protein
MIVLDTNVISEPQRKTPDTQVVEWLDEQPLETLFLTSITLAELRFGISSLPAGKRKDGMLDNLEHRVLPLFTGRVLSFDVAASETYAALMAKAQAAGLAISTADGYIAAIAASNKMIVATRDVSPFEAAGLRVINPWDC